jgi:hypothetical protein
MISPSTQTIDLLCLCLIVPSLLYTLATQLWNLPLKNGPAYFLGMEVAPGFYEGPQARWLSRYHAMLVTVYALDFAALAAVLAAGQWQAVPVWAGSTAIFLTAAMFGFTLWARRSVEWTSPVLSTALSLEPRRLGDYLSWPLEALLVAVVACSWWMLLLDKRAIPWQNALLMTWAVLGTLPGKITVVRQGWPIPADRPEQHRVAQQAARRYSIRLMDAFAWLLASILFMSALRSVWPAARTAGVAQWLVIVIPLAFSLLLIGVITRQKRILDMGRNLRPPGSWTPAFGHAAMMSRSGMIWFTIWFGGILLILVVF